VGRSFKHDKEFKSSIKSCKFLDQLVQLLAPQGGLCCMEAVVTTHTVRQHIDVIELSETWLF
jgi:hypothetical protein